MYLMQCVLKQHLKNICDMTKETVKGSDVFSEWIKKKKKHLNLFLVFVLFFLNLNATFQCFYSHFKQRPDFVLATGLQLGSWGRSHCCRDLISRNWICDWKHTLTPSVRTHTHTHCTYIHTHTMGKGTEMSRVHERKGLWCIHTHIHIHSLSLSDF